MDGQTLPRRNPADSVKLLDVASAGEKQKQTKDINSSIHTYNVCVYIYIHICICMFRTIKNNSNFTSKLTVT